jgi:hypothetical protein
LGTRLDIAKRERNERERPDFRVDANIADQLSKKKKKDIADELKPTNPYDNSYGRE